MDTVATGDNMNFEQWLKRLDYRMKYAFRIGVDELPFPYEEEFRKGHSPQTTLELMKAHMSEEIEDFRQMKNKTQWPEY